VSVSVSKSVLNVCFWATLVVSVVFAILSTAANATSDEDTIEIGFDVQEGVSPQSFNVTGCNYVAPSASGTELTFKCPLSKVYQVEFKLDKLPDAQTQFGNIQVRPGLKRGVPFVGPLHLVKTYSSDYDTGLQRYKDLPEELQPLALANLSDSSDKPAKTDIADPVSEIQVAQSDPQEQDLGPSSKQSDQPGIDIAWDAFYGSIRVNGSDFVDELQEIDGLIRGRLTLKESLGDLFILSSDRNPNCNKSYSVEQLKDVKEVAFDCSEYLVKVPFKVPLEGNQCLALNENEISCLVPSYKKAFKVDLKGWQNVEIAIEEGVDQFDLPLSALRPNFPSSKVLASLNGASLEQCDPKKLVLQLGAFCLNDLCSAQASEAWEIDESGALQSLAEAGWDKQTLPTRAKLILVDVADGKNTVLGEETIPLGPVPEEAVSAMIRKATENTTVPLSIEVLGKIYKVGRNVKIFSDAICETPAATKSLDLSNPGNKVPDVPKCSFYRIFDGKKPRSVCTPIAFDKEAKTASAVLEVVNCGARRLLIYVAENETLNGRNSKAIVASLTKIANEMNDREECAAVDIIHTADEKREVLLTAEDMRFAEEGSDLKSAFDLRFVNSNSEILRDLEWIYREWGDTLGGLIIVADGGKARAANMIDSPASMAWKIKNTYRRVINFSGEENCDVFLTTLLFEECEQGKAGNFEAVLSEYVNQGLEFLASEKSK
jgi:hypothetical protein